MSTLIDPGQSPAAEPADRIAVPTPHYFVAPRKSWTDFINVRMLVFGVVVLTLIGAPFFMWLREAVNGGIIDHGTYYEVNLKAMSSFDFDQFNGIATDIPQKWRDLDGKRIEVIGDMWAPNSASGPLPTFQMCFSRTKCCFSGPPLVQHFVNCTINRGVTAYYYDDPVRAFGVFHVRIVKDGGKIKSIYEMVVDDLEPL